MRMVLIGCLLAACASTDSMRNAATDDPAWDSLDKQAQQLIADSRYDEAARIAGLALEAAESSFGSDHPNVATVLNTLGEVSRKQARYAEAESLIVRSLRIRENSLGPDHLETAASLDNLGELHRARGRYDQAEPLYDRALSIREEALGPEHPDVAVTLNGLANLYKKRGRYDEAESSYTRSLQIREKVLGADHYLVGFSLDNLGLLYRIQGQYARAESLHVKALAIEEKALGPEHRDVAFTLKNLADLYYRLGRYDDAEPLHKRSLAIKEKILGPDHPTVASSLNNLSLLYRTQARYAEAEPLLRRALAIKERSLGPDHPSVAVSLSNLAGLYRSRFQYDDARSLYERALRIQEESLGPQHPRVAGSLSNLASLNRVQSRYAEAESLYRRALTILVNALGDDHLKVAASLDGLAGLQSYQGRLADAETSYKRALSIREASLGRNHPSLAASLDHLSGLYHMQGRYTETESLNKRALRIWEKKLGSDHPDVAISLNHLAGSYLHQHRYAEAEPLYRRMLEIDTEAYGADSPNLVKTLIRLADVYANLGRYTEAEPLMERVFRILEGTTVEAKLRIGAYELRSRLRRSDGDTPGALRDLAESLRLVEETRPLVGGEETRAFYFGVHEHLFDRMVAWLVEQGRMDQAFVYAERGRARALLDQLSAGNIDIRNSIPPDILAPLESRESDAKTRLTEYRQRIQRLQSRKDLSESERLARISTFTDSLRVAEADYHHVYEDIKNASPLWRDVTTVGAKPIDLAAVQRSLVESQSLMLLYQLGKEESHLFVIPPSGQPPTVVRLEVSEEAGDVLGLAPGSLKVDSLKAVLAGPDTTASMAGLILYLKTRPRGLVVKHPEDKEADDAKWATAAARLHALWQVLVPEELWDRLKASREVVVVPDGALHFLAFEALIVEPGAVSDETRYWLDEGPAIRYAPSATVLYNIAQRPATRMASHDDRATVLSLSDPIFDPVEVALTSRSGAQESLGKTQPSLTLALSSETDNTGWIQDSYLRGGGGLDRLPGTALESESISHAFGDQGVQVLSQLDANEAGLRQALVGKRYIHLGTHGLVDQQGDALFAALALTPPIDERPVPEDDGFLQLHEIYELTLPECELAVLSACRTNVGRIVEGEGVFALSRGFLTAGARRIVASQWSVDDMSTAEVMGDLFLQIAEAEGAGRWITPWPCEMPSGRSEARNDGLPLTTGHLLS